MDNNPTPGPTPTPVPEPTPTPNPDLASSPEPAMEPAPEPTSTPVIEPQPVDSATSASADETAPIVNPSVPNVAEDVAVAPAQGKKKISGALIGVIVGVGVLLLGAIVLLVLHFTASTPDKILNSAVEGLLNQKDISFNASIEQSNGEESMNYLVSVYAREGDAAYIRVSGISEIFKKLLSALETDVSNEYTNEVSEMENALNELENNWWKIKTDDVSDSSLPSELSGINLSSLVKAAETYRKYPFLTAQKTSGTYNTSGTPYTLSIDKAKYDTFRSALNDGSTNTALPDISNIDSEATKPIVTIIGSFFGEGTLTGIYLNSEDESSSTKITIDFEHATKTAPADAKDFSEMQKMLTELIGGSSSSDDADSERRNDYALLATSITNYMTSNNGNLPPVGKLDATKYINATGNDPEGKPYDVELVDYASEYDIETSTYSAEIPVYVVWHASCRGNELIDSESDHAFAIYGSLDGGVYCSAN